MVTVYTDGVKIKRYIEIQATVPKEEKEMSKNFYFI